MRYEMRQSEGDAFYHMGEDILFNRWWASVSGVEELPTTKKIAYGAWQAGIRSFIEHQEPICWWATPVQSSDRVTFDKDIFSDWKLRYNMNVTPLYLLPKTKVDLKISNECVD